MHWQLKRTQKKRDMEYEILTARVLLLRVDAFYSKGYNKRKNIWIIA